MKKVIIIVLGVLLCTGAFSQRATKFQFGRIENDTVNIVRTHGVTTVHLSVPATATDTCFVTGDTTLVISGFTTTPLPIAPGGTLLIGEAEGSSPINYLQIISRDTTTMIILSPKR